MLRPQPSAQAIMGPMTLPLVLRLLALVGRKQCGDWRFITDSLRTDGILKNIDMDARDREEDMQEALGDLNTLMKRAQEMVSLYIALRANTYI
jgi:hypothetical protein